MERGGRYFALQEENSVMARPPVIFGTERQILVNFTEGYNELQT